MLPQPSHRSPPAPRPGRDFVAPAPASYAAPGRPPGRHRRPMNWRRRTTKSRRAGVAGASETPRRSRPHAGPHALLGLDAHVTPNARHETEHHGHPKPRTDASSFVEKKGQRSARAVRPSSLSPRTRVFTHSPSASAPTNVARQHRTCSAVIRTFPPISLASRALRTRFINTCSRSPRRSGQDGAVFTRRADVVCDEPVEQLGGDAMTSWHPSPRYPSNAGKTASNFGSDWSPPWPRRR